MTAQARQSTVAKADDAKDEDVTAKADETFIKYTGTGRRVILAEHWANVDVKSQADSIWDPDTNGNRLPKSDFSAKALNYLLHADTQFVEED
jgi:hypothetical protein